jgi:type I restriction enzyme, R subunit
MPLNEPDTCRLYVTPKLQTAGWDNLPYLLGEQRSFTDGRLIVTGGRVRRGERKLADYLLYYRRDFPIAVVEAKAEGEHATTGVQQARSYAEMLGLKFAYATNGHSIIEIDYLTGQEIEIDRYPTPEEIWQRLIAANTFTETTANTWIEPFNLTSGKTPRYYQHIAINRIVESILSGKQRVLVTMATGTGTGKTFVAFQICWKLWKSRWNRSGEFRRPKILYLADRNILVDDPMAKMFAPFEDVRHKISSSDVSQGRDMYFSIYQSLASPANDVFKEYPADFFDLIIIDECHRGSSREDNSWRAILDYFSPAVQLGMTATPLRDETRDTYNYFGNPIYTYSLRQGIEDGFLAPYRVHRVITDVDAVGWRPSKDELDRYGRPIPDDEYQTKDFEKAVALRARTKAIAKHLSNFLKASDRFAKTLVFCVDQEHAAEMRHELGNLNQELRKTYPDYVCRVTSDEGDIGKNHLSKFQDVDLPTPAILTTSQLLTTGVDAEMVKNVVLARVVGSLSEFKQIIGRGTRLNVDYGKEYFNIIDYTGTATIHFADKDFDGEPEYIDETTLNKDGETTSVTVEKPESEEETTPHEQELEETSDPTPTPEPPLPPDPPPQPPRKFYVDGGEVEIIGHLVYDLDTDGKKLQVVKYTDYSGRMLRSMYPSPEEFRTTWANQDTRIEVLRELADRGIDFDELAVASNQNDADPFDLLCHLAWNAPLLSRRERAEKIKKNPDLFAQHGDTAREILGLLLDKYIERGVIQFHGLSDLMKTPPFNHYGLPAEIANLHFGGVLPMRQAVVQLQETLYQ